jgi:hypothetical protein
MWYHFLNKKARPKPDYWNQEGAAYICPFGWELPIIPNPDCSPRSKKQNYVMCSICKELQEEFRGTPLQALPQKFRVVYGPNSITLDTFYASDRFNVSAAAATNHTRDPAAPNPSA